MKNNNIFESLWTAFNDISFEESTHKYTDSKGTRFHSVTGWIKQFVPDTDWDKISYNCAIKELKKAGVLKDMSSLSDEEKKMISGKMTEIKEKWKKSGEYACDLGTQIHSVMENLWYKKDYRFDKRLNEKWPEMERDFEWRKQNRCKTLFNKMKKVYAPVANEFIVYDADNAICGTIDMIGYNMITGDYAIIDWKTSKKFTTESFHGDEFLNAPFDDLEECNTNEYSLQLSTYKYMLEKKVPIKISELLLFQIPGEENKVPMVHRCRDLSSRIKDFLEKKQVKANVF